MSWKQSDSRSSEFKSVSLNRIAIPCSILAYLARCQTCGLIGAAGRRTKRLVGADLDKYTSKLAQFMQHNYAASRDIASDSTAASICCILVLEA